MDPLRSPDPKPERGPLAQHAIVVLGCATEPDGTPTARLRRRLEAALARIQADPDAIVIVTGGAVHSPAEGPAMRDWLVAHAVPEDRILVEDQAMYTLDNIRRVAPMVRKIGACRVTVVTERFHLMRGQTLMSAELVRRGWSDIAVSGVGAKDGLSPEQRIERREQERNKLLRDLDTLLSQPDLFGHLFAPERFSRAAASRPVRAWAA